MEKILIEATARTPKFDFDPEKRTLVLSGESYPEDPQKFFAAPLVTIREFLKQKHDGLVQFNFQMTYFNSSSAKVMMDLFSALEDCATEGNDVMIEWHHADDDDNMRELGEEFSEELVNAKFKLLTFNWSNDIEQLWLENFFPKK